MVPLHPRDSIRARMTVSFSLALALLLIVACSGAIFYTRHVSERNANNILVAACKKMHRELEDGMLGNAIPAIISDERDLTGETLAIFIVDKGGHVTDQSQNRLPDWPDYDQREWRAASVSFGEQRDVVIAFPWRRMEITLETQAVLLVGISLVVFVAGSIGAWLLVGRTLSPIGRLAQQAQVASADNLQVRLHPSSQDTEIVGLVTTLNGLLSRLTEAAAARGRFYSAASHELRTPLQALSGHLELALARPRTAEEYLTVTREAHAQTRRLMVLVHDLLMLNRLELGTMPPREPVDLTLMCERALYHSDALIAARRLCVKVTLPDELMLEAPPTHVEMLTRNLIENAIKYAREGGNVRIEAVSSTCLIVFDECDPLPEWNPEKLFEPFYRPDASRHSRTGGNGLGLAICKAIAEINGWKITLEQDRLGVSATVQFS